MKNILLTGSNGFVGKYFVSKYISKYNINKFSFLKDDFSDLDLSKTNTIIHLSALVHKMEGATKEEYERINVTQTIRLSKKAKELGVKHFIFMSTVKIYGEETNLIYKENSECKPEDEYAKSKYKAEIELLKLNDDTFKVSVIRTPIIYGYGVKANIKSLINLVSKVRVLPFNNTNNKRSMVYIGNLCNLIDAIILKKKRGIFLASDDATVSTTDFIDYISKSIGAKTILIKIPFFEVLLKIIKPNFHKRLYKSLEIDNTLTKEILELKNPYTLEEGIEYMINGKDN